MRQVCLAFSILASVMFIGENTLNEQQLRIGIARKIDQQQDPITEYLFGDLAADIQADRKLRLSLTNSPIDAENVLQILHDKLGYDHWNRYLAIVDVFTNEGGLMVSDRELTGPNYFETSNRIQQISTNNFRRFEIRWKLEFGRWLLSQN
jgi:hypothetical protein